MIVVDTSVMIDVLRRQPRAVAWWVDAEGLAASEISRLEVLRGMRSIERSKTIALLHSLRWHDLDATVSQRAGELGREYRRSHPGIDAADLCVAATAQLLDVPLATSNVRHFPMFSRLEPPY